MIYSYLKNKTDCTGCSACFNSCPVECIKMEANSEGFYYPEVDEDKCINCKKCISSCPLYKDENNNENNFTTIAAFNKNENIRVKSSSGGIFEILARKIIDENGAVYGVCFDEEFKVIHNFTENKNDIYQFMGSKYVQSNQKNTFVDIKNRLENGQKVLYTGTPCQNAGLKSYLKKEYNNLFSVDLICHGVPSPKVFQKYIEFQEQKNKSKIKEFSFRDKRNGWSKFGISIVFENGKKYYKNLYKDIYMIAFLKDISLRSSCYNCNFKTLNRSSDITLADFWGISAEVPEYNDNRGVSLIMLNSEKGKVLLKEISNEINYKTVDNICIEKHNPAAVKSAKVNKNREKFFGELDRFRIDKLILMYCVDKMGLRIMRKVKKMTSKFIR